MWCVKLVLSRPKKFLHASQDEAFKPAIHELHEGQKLTEEVCRYDLDDLDILWLQTFNEICEEIGEIYLALHFCNCNCLLYYTCNVF